MKRKNYNLMIGGAITLFFLAVALIGQFWTPYGTTTMDSMAVNLRRVQHTRWERITSGAIF